MSDETEGQEKFEMIRRSIRNAVITLATAGGVEPIDAAIGAVYATHDLALFVGMDAHAAIEWMRTATDQMERHLLAAARDAG